MSDDGRQDDQEAAEGLPPSIPAMPPVQRSALHRGQPDLLVESGLRHSLGWQDHRKAGPSFVVVRIGWLDRVKIISRFPLNDQGWETAWRSLSAVDADAAKAVGAKLARMQAHRAAAAALAELDAQTMCRLRGVTYNGGSGDVPLAGGKMYDLRFLGDRLEVRPPGSATATIELPYRDVDALEVSGSDHGMAVGQQVTLVLGLGLAGALLGLIILGVLGLLLGALLCGLIGALVAAASAKSETIVRVHSGDAELFFASTVKSPDAVRIELSGALTAIASARTAQPSGSAEPADQASESVPDQLSKLASLLADGVLSREEFEHLKAKVIAQA